MWYYILVLRMQSQKERKFMVMVIQQGLSQLEQLVRPLSQNSKYQQKQKQWLNLFLVLFQFVETRTDYDSTHIF